jgi:hypothetical protein
MLQPQDQLIFWRRDTGMHNKQAIGTAFAMALFVFTVADAATIWRLHHNAASSKAEQVIMRLIDEDRGEISKAGSCNSWRRNLIGWTSAARAA